MQEVPLKINLEGSGGLVTLSITPTDNSDKSADLFARVRNALIRGDSDGRFDKSTTLKVVLPAEMFVNSNRQIKVAIDDVRSSVGIPIGEITYEHQRQDPTITPEIPRPQPLSHVQQ